MVSKYCVKESIIELRASQISWMTKAGSGNRDVFGESHILVRILFDGVDPVGAQDAPLVSQIFLIFSMFRRFSIDMVDHGWTIR
jgi:hypothetical protein